MKKIILIVVVIFATSLMFTSCKSEKKEETKEQTSIENKQVASNDVYQCPMDCEEGKTYKKEGDCPVCKMKLKKKEAKKTEVSR